MKESFRIPVLDAVAEGESYYSHAYESENTEKVEKITLHAELIVHILCINKYSSRGKNTPQPKPQLSFLAEQRQRAELRDGIVSPEKRQCESVDKSA